MEVHDQARAFGGVRASSEYNDSNFFFVSNRVFDSVLLTQFFNALKPSFYKAGFPIMGRYQLGVIARTKDSIILAYHPKYQYQGHTITITTSFSDNETVVAIPVPLRLEGETLPELTVRWLTLAYTALIEAINRDIRLSENFSSIPSLADLNIGVEAVAPSEPASPLDPSWEN